MDLAAAKKHLEINPANLIIQSLLQKVSKDENDVTIKNFVLLLFDIGLLTSGFPLLNPMVRSTSCAYYLVLVQLTRSSSYQA